MIYKILAVFVVLSLASCDDWLEVQPKQEIKSDKMFETEGGFKDALIGVYLGMTEPELYGREMMFGFVDVIGQQYYMSSNNEYYQCKRLNYEDGTAIRCKDEIWSYAYNVIANINNILDNIEAKKEQIHPTSYAIIKGECLGLRAYLHFDIFRLFGYGGLANRPEVSGLPTIPYVRMYDKGITPQYSSEKVLEYIMQDLTDAKNYLVDQDPISTVPKAPNYELLNDDEFFSDRKKRFNYYATLSTIARVALWKGDYDLALTSAREVVDSDQFGWISESNISLPDEASRDLTFSVEHVFGLKVFDHNSSCSVEEYFVQGEGNTNYSLLYHSTSKANSLFESDGVGASDYRYLNLYHLEGSKNWFLKFRYFDGSNYKDNVPLIRKTELYYIMAECLVATGNDNDRLEAITLLNRVRRYRGIVDDISVDSTLEEVSDEILKEYQKEFLCEGQMFYYYKRLNLEDIPNTSVMGDDNVYTLPLPDVEVEFGGRVLVGQ